MTTLISKDDDKTMHPQMALAVLRIMWINRKSIIVDSDGYYRLTMMLEGSTVYLSITNHKLQGYRVWAAFDGTEYFYTNAEVDYGWSGSLYSIVETFIMKFNSENAMAEIVKNNGMPPLLALIKRVDDAILVKDIPDFLKGPDYP